jgi:hypothetical protein
VGVPLVLAAAGAWSPCSRTPRADAMWPSAAARRALGEASLLTMAPGHTAAVCGAAGGARRRGSRGLWLPQPRLMQQAAAITARHTHTHTHSHLGTPTARPAAQ